jgi:hypothetical protein
MLLPGQELDGIVEPEHRRLRQVAGGHGTSDRYGAVKSDVGHLAILWCFVNMSFYQFIKNSTNDKRATELLEWIGSSLVR